MRTVNYGSLRGDWVIGADLLARLMATSTRDGVLLEGFPRQWIPVMVQVGATWRSTTEPNHYVPIASDLTESALVAVCQRAREEGRLRVLVEAFASLDPLLADVLYKLDRRGRAGGPPHNGQPILLTGWQSYGRPDVLELNQRIAGISRSRHRTAVIMPCAKSRPYDLSRTHRRIWRGLEAMAIAKDTVDQIVVSAVGVVPQAAWSDPVVLAYDSGVPDIYRILRLMRLFFRKAKYQMVVDCLDFAPYSDCLAIVQREGMIGSIQLGPRSNIKRLPRP